MKIEVGQTAAAKVYHLNIVSVFSMKLRIKFSIRFLLAVTVVVALFVAWITSEVANGRRDAENLEFFWGAPNSPLMNAYFETGYVIIPTWMGDSLGWASEPFQRVLEIDFRIDNVDDAEDILPYTVFKNVSIIRIGSFPKARDGILSFSEFENLRCIYVSRPSGQAEMDLVSRLLPGIEIKLDEEYSHDK